LKAWIRLAVCLRNIILLGDRAIHSFNGARKHYSLIPNKMNHTVVKNYWFWVVVILVAFTFFFYLPLPGSDKPARFTIEFGNGNVRAFEGPTVKGMTILQALLSASYGGGFDFKYSLDKNGDINLAAINGAVNGQKNWHFYLNGKPIEAGEIARTKIKAGDSIEARYE
jgi:hypothetical protein